MSDAARRRIPDETLEAVATMGDAVGARLAREVLRLRRRIDEGEQKRRDGRLRRACLSALREPGTVADVASRLGWSYRRARGFVHQLLRTKAITRVDTVRSVSGQLAGRYKVTS